MGLILNIIASILKWALTPLLFIWGNVESLCRGEFTKYHENLAIAKDEYGNVLGQYAFNFLLIKKNSVNKFGKLGQTISKVLGLNKLANTLKSLGKLLCLILNKIEPNHVEKAAKKIQL